MKLLLSNDDGVHSPGLHALEKYLSTLGETTVVAPDRNRSAASNSLTLHRPLRTFKLRDNYYSVNGTPTDCVHLAINGLLHEKPAMVVSGINQGANLGDDVLYSGTVAAATEGRFLGFPAIAVSLVGESLVHYDTAAEFTKMIIQKLIDKPLAPNSILNINVPDLPISEVKGIKVCRLGYRHQSEPIITERDPRGHEIFWVGPPGSEQDAGPGTDFHAVNQGYVSVTPLKVDLTAHQSLAEVEEWIMET